MIFDSLKIKTVELSILIEPIIEDKINIINKIPHFIWPNTCKALS
jgi:hypothetical protein